MSKTYVRAAPSGGFVPGSEALCERQEELPSGMCAEEVYNSGVESYNPRPSLLYIGRTTGKCLSGLCPSNGNTGSCSIGGESANPDARSRVLPPTAEADMVLRPAVVSQRFCTWRSHMAPARLNCHRSPHPPPPRLGRTRFAQGVGTGHGTGFPGCWRDLRPGRRGSPGSYRMICRASLI